MRPGYILVILTILPVALLSAPDDYGSGIYIAPILTSGHFGITADNIPELYSPTPPATVSLSTASKEATRGLSFGAKVGIFHRPEIYEQRHRLDFEVQTDYFSGDFNFQTYEATASGDTAFSVTSWGLYGIGVVGRIRWSAEVHERWQPFVHMGYGVNMITLEGASGIGHGVNVGGGMRVRLCSKYAFYFEYETNWMNTVVLPIAKIDNAIDVALGSNISADVALHPGYSQVSVGFEVPIAFGQGCAKAGRTGFKR